MTFNAMTEHYEEITVCGKPALFTTIRIKRDLAIVVGLIGRCGSPRRAFYTITDELMNSAYRFKRSWQFKNSLP